MENHYINNFLKFIHISKQILLIIKTKMYNFNKNNKKIIINNFFKFFLGIHAREWISPATATFIIRELVVNSNFNSDVLDFYDFYVLPVANPDGYKFFNNFLIQKTYNLGFLF